MNEYQDFFKDRWGEKAEEEAGDVHEEGMMTPEEEFEHYEDTESVRVYKEIKEQASFDDMTRKLFGELEDNILNYYYAITALEKARRGDERDIMSEADKNRRTRHDVVIGNLDALSRYTGKHGLDNEWRRVVGLNRTEVTNWVKNVAPYIILSKGK